MAQIYFRLLNDKVTAKAIRSALQDFQKQIPGSSEDKKVQVLAYAYEQAMGRINGQEQGFKDLAHKVLSWITCAKRQITTTELQHGLAVEVQKLELDKENFPQIEDIVSACAGLVTVDEESNIIRLVHYTTQQYFERTWTSWFPDAQINITSVCVTYLSFDIFKTGFCQSDEEFEARLQTNVLYDYAARYWGHHAHTASIKEDLILDLLESRAKVSAASQAMMASRSYSNYSQRVPMEMTGVHVAAYFGLEGAIIGLLNNGRDTGKADVNSKDSYGRTPLWWAALNGDEAIVKLLLETGKVDIECKDKDNWTPLLWAIEGGHKAVVKLLLKAGARANRKYSVYVSKLTLSLIYTSVKLIAN